MGWGLGQHGVCESYGSVVSRDLLLCVEDAVRVTEPLAIRQGNSDRPDCVAAGRFAFGKHDAVEPDPHHNTSISIRTPYQNMTNTPAPTINMTLSIV